MSTTNLKSVFRSLDEQGTGKVSQAAVLECLSKAGIDSDDARLSTLHSRLDLINGTDIGSKTFASLLENSGTLVSRAAKGELIIPDFESFSREIREIFEGVRGNTGGAVADYIPQLARVPADSFAVAITTIDGQQFSIGDVENGFTLQSSCKPMLYAAALEEHGVDKVHAHVGREPSGLSFNELTLNKAGLPHNPLINAGAIMTSSLIRRELSTAAATRVGSR